MKVKGDFLVAATQPRQNNSDNQSKKSKLKPDENIDSGFAFLPLNIILVSANSAGAVEMPHNAAFHLGLHCLQMYPFIGFPISKWLKC